MPLSISDWVTIAATGASIITSAVISIGVAIWQVRRSSAPRQAGIAKQAILDTEIRKWLLAQAWPVLIHAALGVYFVTKALAGPEPVTQAFVVQFVCGTLLLSFCLLYSALLILAAAFRPAYLLMGRIAERTSLPHE